MSLFSELSQPNKRTKNRKKKSIHIHRPHKLISMADIKNHSINFNNRKMFPHLVLINGKHTNKENAAPKNMITIYENRPQYQKFYANKYDYKKKA